MVSHILVHKIPELVRTKLVLSVFVLSALLVAPASAVEAPRPNILLVMCDDMGYSDVGCYGSEIDTPHIDRLAREGMRFTQFYNNAKCTTTRASLITGLYPRKGGRGKQLLSDQMVTIAEVLRDAGYQTSLSGKWHLGSEPPHRPIDRGFDEFYGLMDGACNYFDPAQPDPDFKGNRRRVFGHNETLIKEFPDDFYFTDAVTDHAISTIRRMDGQSRPWFAHVTYTAPHYPLHAKPADIAKYRGRYRGGWEQLRKDRYARQLQTKVFGSREVALSPVDELVYSWDQAQQDWEDQRMAVYAAMIDNMDQNIGRILGLLDDLRITENTLVIFLSDNGGCAEEPGGRRFEDTPGPKDFYTAVGPAWAWAQNTPFRRFKTWMHEGGIATPMIVRFPKLVENGSVSHSVGHIVDFLPTCLELAGGTYPEMRNGKSILPLEGMSLISAMTGTPQARDSPLYWSFNGNAAVRDQNWKLVWDRSVKRWELYDMLSDRSEVSDVADAHPDVVTSLSTLWLEWAQLTDARIKGLNR